ncbi:MAG TPA: ribonucleotide reductase N-terminal alpha domain-containing protein, partial [Elusimicrobiota bacterium]|nr:ribonucleotide reductase N-terminal alpha domain-containing protein [Elusimicrobiota bacterium]
MPDAPRPRVPGAALLALVRTRTSGARAPEGKAAQCSYVVDRHGRKVPVQFDQITARNRELCDDEQYGARLRAIDCPLVTVEVIRRFRDGMTTRELDAETALICAQRTSHSSDYDALAARICVSDQHKRIPADQLEALDALRADAPDERSVRFTDELYAVARRARAAIAERLDHARDYRLKFFGFQTALGGLLRSGRRRDPLSLRDTRPSERLQHAYMRVALGIHVCQPDGKGAEAPEAAFRARLEEAFALYDALSAQLVSQATPTLLNAGTKRPQMSSCFQLGVGDDLDSILSTLREAGLISKWSGGISFWLHGVRSEGAPIRGTTGESSGLKYLLRLWNDMQRYVDQGGNRKGAFAATIADHHPNVLDVLRQARPGGEMSATGEDLSAADLKYALWVSDAFMEALTAQIAAEERAERGQDADPAAGDWPLFDPDVAPGLHLVHGDAFVALRARYIREGRAKVTVKAGAIIAEAFKAWSHVGTPYVMFKDAINRKSNMQNVAPICSSNLCVGGDTRVLTRRGYAAIRGLEGDAVEVWNGAEWSRVTVCKTNTAAALVRVTFGSGAQVECTPYHKFYTSASAEVRAGELQPGMRLERCPCMPVVEGGSPLRDAYARGLACAVRSPDVPASDTVPLYGSDVASRLEWFAGLCDGDAVRGEGHSIRVTSAGREFLLEVRLLLQTLGCDPKVVPEARRATPRDRAPRHHLLVTSGDTAALLRLGFRPRRLALAGDGGRVHRAGPSARVVSVERLEGLHETFCFTEPRRHRGIFNGVIGGQCCE